MSRFAIPAIAATLAFLLGVPVVASSREWIRRAGEIHADGQLESKWSHYATSDEESPFLSKRFFRRSGHHLVIETEHTLETGDVTTTMTLLETGESLQFLRQATGLTITYDTQVLTIDESEIDDEATKLSPALEAAGRSIIESGSQQLQDALASLRFVGCHQSPELYLEAFLLAAFFEPKCAVPTQRASPTLIQPGFDMSTPPTTFELEFGGSFTFEN